METPGKAKRIRDVIEGVNGLCSMSCIDAKSYAVENGWAHIVAEHIYKNKKMNYTQLRKFFDSVKNIKKDLKTYDKDRLMDDIPDIKQLRYELFPELAYALSRELITGDFYKLMKTCLGDKIVKVKDFIAFEKFLSAIVAYSRACDKLNKLGTQKGEGEDGNL